MFNFTLQDVISAAEPDYRHEVGFTGYCFAVAFTDYEGTLTPSLKVRDFNLADFGDWKIMRVAIRAAYLACCYSDRRIKACRVKYENGIRTEVKILADDRY